MAEGTQDNSFWNKKVTKRQLVRKSVTAGAVGVLITSGLGGVGFAVGDRKGEGSNPLKSSPADSSQNTVASSQEPAISSARSEKTSDYLIKENPMFVNCTDVEKEAALKIVKERIDFYSGIFRRFDTSEKIARTLKLKKQVDKSYELVKDKIDNLELDKNGLSDEQIRDLLLNVIFVESGGVPTAFNSDSGATGACQLLPSTAEQTAKLVGIPFSEEKLKDADYNIQLASVHFRRLLNTFHDPSMALWSYHFGDGNMKKVIKVYLESILTTQEYKNVTDEYEEVRRVPEFDKVDLNKKKDNRKSSARIIDYYKLNFVKLITSDAVKRWLENKRKESGESDRVVSETLKYVPSLGAAAHLLRENNKAV